MRARRDLQRRGAWVGLGVATFTGLLAGAVGAQEPELSAGGEVWGYASHLEVREDPAGAWTSGRARVPQTTQTIDLRLDGALRFEPGTEAVFKPRVLVQTARDVAGGTTQSTRVTLGQGYLKTRLGESATVVLGRERVAWGPAQLRSPSSPFYFDAGRTRPLTEAPGIDLVRAVVSSRSTSFSFGHVQGGPDLGREVEHATYAKADYVGQTVTVSLNAASARDASAFWGGYLTWTPDAAWVVYAEAGSVPATVAADRIASDPRARRQSVAALGASYAFESGVSLTVEGLYDGRGLRRTAAQALLSDRQRGVAPAQAATATLIGQRYVYVMVQSDLQQSDSYWRAAMTRSLVGTGSQFLLYGEKNLRSQLSALASVVAVHGGARTEFGALARWQVTVGLKWISR